MLAPGPTKHFPKQFDPRGHTKESINPFPNLILHHFPSVFCWDRSYFLESWLAGSNSAFTHTLIEIAEDEASWGVCLEEWCKHKGLHSHKLDEDIEGRSRCVLQWISHCVSNDCCNMAGRPLASQRTGMLRCTSLHTKHVMTHSLYLLAYTRLMYALLYSRIWCKFPLPLLPSSLFNV